MNIDALRTTSSPLVSVILPVFNAEKFLKDSVQSILDQSFMDFELILIDDGSTDSSLKILKMFESNDDRVKLISRENRGLVVSLNEGVALACGSWIARMDADDIALPQRFERQLQWLSNNDADICGSWIKYIGKENNRIIEYPQSDEAIKKALLFNCPFAHPTVMMKAELVKKLRYDSYWEKAEDYELWVRAALVGWRMINVPEVLLMYRRHDEQISSTDIFAQAKLSQKIRRIYWTHSMNSIGCDVDGIDEVLKLSEGSASLPNMDIVDSIFIKILQLSGEEALKETLCHITRLYFQVAATCPNVASRLARIHRLFGVNFSRVTKVKLILLGILKLRPDSAMYRRLKKTYHNMIRWCEFVKLVVKKE